MKVIEEEEEEEKDHQTGLDRHIRRTRKTDMSTYTSSDQCQAQPYRCNHSGIKRGTTQAQP